MGLIKYVITGDIIEVYKYSKYIKGNGGANRTNTTFNRVFIRFKSASNIISLLPPHIFF